MGYPLQYSWASLVAQLVKNLPAMWETWVGKIPCRREKLPTPVFWPGEFHGLYSPWGHKESDTTKQLSQKSNEFLIKLLARKVSCSAYMFFLRSRKRIYHLGQTDVNESLVDSRACVWTELVFDMCPLPALAPCPTLIFRLHAVQPNHGPLVL